MGGGSKHQKTEPPQRGRVVRRLAPQLQLASPPSPPAQRDSVAIMSAIRRHNSSRVPEGPKAPPGLFFPLRIVLQLLLPTGRFCPSWTRWPETTKHSSSSEKFCLSVLVDCVNSRLPSFTCCWAACRLLASGTRPKLNTSMK